MPSEAYNPQTSKVVVSLPHNSHDTNREYITSDTGAKPPFLRYISDEAYSEALSGAVIKCVDIMVYDPNTGRMLIGTRDQQPHAGDWVIGGRKRAGESDREAAVNNLRRELKLDVDEKSLIPVGTQYDMIWDTREQSSVLNEQGHVVQGCHMTSTLLALPFEEADMGFNEEYSGLRWVSPEEIIDSEPGAYHPTLVDMVTDTYERITRPEPATSLAEQQLRAVGQLATINAAIRGSQGVL